MKFTLDFSKYSQKVSPIELKKGGRISMGLSNRPSYSHPSAPIILGPLFSFSPSFLRFLHIWKKRGLRGRKKRWGFSLSGCRRRYGSCRTSGNRRVMFCRAKYESLLSIFFKSEKKGFARSKKKVGVLIKRLSEKVRVQLGSGF